MKLTTQGRYAVTAMLDLALNAAVAPCSLHAISGRQGISRHYLEQIFLKLRQGGLVRSVRGPSGGYRLSRPAAKISVAQIIHAVDKPVDVTRCGGAGNCQNGYTCLTHHLWADLGSQIRSFLDDITLAQLMQRPEIRTICERQQHLQAEEGIPQTLTHGAHGLRKPDFSQTRANR